MTAGRPCTLTEEMIPQLCKAIDEVLSLNQAANLCEIPRTTIIDWIKRGNNHALTGQTDSLYYKLSTSVKKAQGEAARARMACLMNGDKNWQASAWILERVFREDFGSNSREVDELTELVKQLKQDMAKLKS